MSAPRTRQDRSKRSGGQRLAMVWLALLTLLAVGGEWLPLPSAHQMDLLARAERPSAYHLLGTDSFGRDIAARLVLGARSSLIVAFGASAIGLVLGALLGLLAGFYRGATERLVLLLTDTLLAFPGLVLAMLFSVYLGRSLASITLILGLLTVPAFTRVSRTQTLQVSAEEFVAAATAVGLPRARTLARHVAPNVMPALLSFALLVAGVIVILEGALSFLGLGLPDQMPSWGGMISEGREHLEQAPHLSALPALALAATIAALNAIGNTSRGSSAARLITRAD